MWMSGRQLSPSHHIRYGVCKLYLVVDVAYTLFYLSHIGRNFNEEKIFANFVNTCF